MVFLFSIFDFRVFVLPWLNILDIFEKKNPCRHTYVEIVVSSSCFQLFKKETFKQLLLLVEYIVK